MAKSSFLEHAENVLLSGQEFLIGTLSFLDAYDGLITSIATGFIAYLTYHLVQENRILRQVGTEPEVIAYLIPHPKGHGGINFIIENIGLGVAKNLSFSLECDQDDFASHNVLLNNDPARTQFAFLPAKEKISALFGVSFELAGSNCNGEWLKPFDVILEYQDIKNRKHKKKYTLDLSCYRGLKGGTLDEPTIETISKSLANIDKNFQSLLSTYRSGISKKESSNSKEETK
ncbi:MAG: hypothetical protein ACLFP8_07630 [Alphaproteobacteria bacterium]